MALPSLWRPPPRISDAGGAPTRCSRRRKGRGDSPFVTFSRQTDCGSLSLWRGRGVRSNEALAFWFVLGNAKMNIQAKRSVAENNRTLRNQLLISINQTNQ
ncbi:MAG: hypothetical protein LBS20_03075 [Prevotella sp.]|nr:hypothetical protein [Prevotella sp.]